MIALAGLLRVLHAVPAHAQLAGDLCRDSYLMCHCLHLSGMKPNATFPMTMRQTQPGVLGLSPDWSKAGAGETLTLDVTTDANGEGCLGFFAIWGLQVGRSAWHARCENCLPGGGGYDTGYFPVEVFAVESAELLPINTPLTEDNPPSAGGGLRIFPEKVGADDGLDRRKFKVRAVVNSVTPHRRIRFWAEDLDDPATDPAIDPDGDQEGDNLGAGAGFTGGMNEPGCNSSRTGCQVGSIVVEEDGGVAEAEFTVSTQPGDNFRIHAAALDDLCYKSTPMFTVWRTLHLEVDSMGAVTGNTVSGLVTTVDKNRTTITVVPDPVQTLKDGRFQHGRISIQSLGDFETAGNTTSRKGVVSVKLATPLPRTPLKPPFTFTMVDDDDMLNRAPGQPLLLDGDEGRDVPPPILDLLQDSDDPARNVFAPAYIRPRYDVGVTDDDVPFLLNAPGVFDKGGSLVNRDEVRSTYRFDAGPGTDPDFWTAYLLGAYQATPAYDGDPDGLTLVGLSDGEQGAHVYQAAYGEAVLLAKGLRAEQTAAHELGHLFANGTDVHQDGGLMAPPLDAARTAAFAGTTIRKIRSTVTP